MFETLEKEGWVVVDESSGEKSFNWPRIIKMGSVVFLVLILVIAGWPMKIVGATERGITYMFGKPSNEVLDPGVHFHAPFFGSIKTWSIVPNKLAIDIPINNAGAISKDNQIIGVRLVLYWQYDENRIYDIATGYTDKTIENILASDANASIKSVIGSYTIFDLADNQAKIGDSAYQLINSHLSNRPIKITQVNISNFDWSKEFGQQIQATMNAAQQVRQAEQKANIAEQDSRREVIESQAHAQAEIAAAEGRLRTAELDAQSRVAKAEGERDAKIAEGEGIQRYNQLVAQNLSVEIRLRELEIELERAKRWDGREVPMYLPLSPNGGVVTLPSK